MLQPFSSARTVQAAELLSDHLGGDEQMLVFCINTITLMLTEDKQLAAALQHQVAAHLGMLRIREQFNPKLILNLFNVMVKMMNLLTPER